MSNNNIFDKIEYAQWLEEALKELIEFPVKGICIHAIGEDGAVYGNYYEISIGNKHTIAGVIQQDAMYDFLSVNGFIKNDEMEE